MRKPVLISFVFALAVVGCDRKIDSTSKTPKQSASAVERAEEKTPEAPKPEPVADLESKDITASFGCPSKNNAAICNMVEEFDKASPWDLTTIQAETARYFGQATTLKNGNAEQRWVFMTAKKMPLNEVQPGDLAVRVALRDLDPQLVAENKHAAKLLYLLKNDDAVSKRNRTSEYILSYNPTSWDTAAPTKGNSSILHIDDGAFVRMGNKRVLYLIGMQAAKPGSNAIEATIMKLYPLSW